MGLHITYFVHGTTTDNEQGIATGQAPGELSMLGVDQSKRLPTLLRGKEFDVVFCSDLKRAIDSAKLAFEGKCNIIVDKRMRECDYGELTGLKKSWEIKDYIDKPYPGGESYKQVEARIRHFLTFLKAEFSAQSVAIVGHQAPQLALDVIIKGISWEAAIAQDWREQKAWQPGWDYEVQ
jgi:broad specificity phosphatase PhoE